MTLTAACGCHVYVPLTSWLADLANVVNEAALLAYYNFAGRDLRDRTRAEAPLTAAPDAVLLDTSDLGRDAAIAEAIRIVRERAR